MELSLPECAAQLGAAMLSLKQLGARADEMKLAAFLIGFGIALALGIAATIMFYERRYCGGIAFQRNLDKGLYAQGSTIELIGWRGRVGAWSDKVNALATKVWSKNVAKEDRP